MDSNFMRSLMMSMGTFGPLFAIFAIGLFIGVLVALEKTGVLAKLEKARRAKKLAAQQGTAA